MLDLELEHRMDREQALEPGAEAGLGVAGAAERGLSVAAAEPFEDLADLTANDEVIHAISPASVYDVNIAAVQMGSMFTMQTPAGKFVRTRGFGAARFSCGL